MDQEKTPPHTETKEPSTAGAMTPEAEAFARLIGELIAARWRKMNPGERVPHQDRKVTASEPPPKPSSESLPT